VSDMDTQNRMVVSNLAVLAKGKNAVKPLY